MTKRYRHRVGVRAEICFDIVMDSENPATDQLAQAVSDTLIGSAGPDKGFSLNALPEGKVFPDWNSVDPEIEPTRLLDSSAIRSLDCEEIDSIQ